VNQIVQQRFGMRLMKVDAAAMAPIYQQFQ
jgi:hypothetical protein